MPTKPLQQKITKPRQAGSSRTLDRIERDLLLIRAAVQRLIDTVRKSERR